MRKISYFFLIINFTLLACQLNLALAATVRIDKPKIRLTVPRGGAKSGKVDIENPSGETIRVNVYLEDWLYDSNIEGSKEFFPPGTTALSCANWISFAPAELFIPPYGKQAISYSVNCPQDAQGGHYAVMFFETALGEAKDEKGVSVKVLGRLGTLFAIEPQGTIIREARIDNLKIEKNGDLKIKLDFTNIGNVDITPEGTFYIMDENGIIAARGKFEKTYTLPGDQTIIASSISKANLAQINDGEYDLIVTIDLGGIPHILEAKLKFGPSGKVSYSLP